MNKILTINLGGYPYTIDDDAYEFLNRYLDSIRRHFRNNASYSEIIGDIETRLAEIFSEKLGTRTIISMKDVQETIAIMGRPEEFAGDTDDTTGGAAAGAGGTAAANDAYERFRREYRTGKRLFRDTDDKVFGGVCSGVAAYFGIEDPLWVRIGFAVAFFSFGVGFLLYFLLWIIVPDALTSADRLAMRGEPANIENIARVVEEEFNSISNRFNNGSGTQNSRTYATSGGAKGVVSNIFSFFGEIFYGIINILKVVAKPIVFFFGVIAFIVLAAFWVAFGVGAKEGYPFAHYAFGDNTFMGTLAFINVFFLIGLALLGIGLLIARIFFKIRVNKVWGLGIGLFWLLNGVSFGLLGATFGKEFNREARVTQDVFNVSLPSDTIYLEIEEDNRFSDFHTNFGPFKFDQEKLLNGDVRLEIKESKTSDFRLEKEAHAHGNTREEAETLANQIDYKPRLEGNRLILPEYFLMQNTKFRGQEIKMFLSIPNGKYIKIDEKLNDIVRFDFDDRKYDIGHWERYKKVWKMENGEITSPQVEKERNFESSYELKGFSRVEVEGYTNVSIKQGDVFSVKVIGEEEIVKEIEVDKSGNTLKIDARYNSDHDSNDKVKVVITMPQLELIGLENVREVSISGFVQNEMSINTDGDFKLKADFDIKKLKINADKNTQIVLKGKGDSLELILEDGAEINARQYEVRTATTSMHSGTEADIYVTEKVQNRRNEGNLTVEGGAKIEKTDKSE